MNIAINAVVMDEECILLSGDQLFYEDSITKPHKLIEVRKIEINWKSLAN
ncbi:MAG: hypothetical protein U5K72_17730 [Balneolaceae bacterium]|nr:hypothetical protein [Balneolaceae bacterium]